MRPASRRPHLAKPLGLITVERLSDATISKVVRTSAWERLCEQVHHCHPYRCILNKAIMQLRVVAAECTAADACWQRLYSARGL